MKKVEFEQYSNEELLSKRNSFYTELFNLRTQLITGQLGNMKKVKERKKDIARIYKY
ncbi:MAG: 50S ribosomal protein L29 [Candidatus Omnitrophica bacterium]|nr:50S ribosomal protein L29 [Candidatus Omnitrophota bacterium]